MKKWVYLLAAISLEVTGSLSLKGALEAPGLYALVVVGYTGAFLFLFLAMRAGMGLGVAYGIWGAGGVTLTAVMSSVIFGEPITVLMACGIGLVIGGVLLVELGSQVAQKQSNDTARVAQ